MGIFTQPSKHAVHESCYEKKKRLRERIPFRLFKPPKRYKLLRGVIL